MELDDWICFIVAPQVPWTREYHNEIEFTDDQPFTNGATWCTSGSGIMKVLALIVMVVFYGFWKLGKGIVYLVRPQSERKSIPDISDADILE
jgi:hypothetical protein